MKQKFSLLLMFGLLLGFSSCDLIDDSDPVGVIVEVTSNITAPELWSEGNTYVIDGTVRVSADITIEPGAIIKFNEEAQLEIAYWDNENATIKAIGTAEKPITFTSNAANPAAGDYNGIGFYNGANNCEFVNCIFEYGGNSEYYTTIFISDTDVKFESCTFRNISNSAIRLMEDGSFTQFTNNTFNNVQKNPIEIQSNFAHSIGAGNTFNANSRYGIQVTTPMNVAGNYTWLAHDAPYIIPSNIRVGSDGSGVNLTIEAGATLQFGDEAELEFAYWDTDYAKIIAKGTEQNPIRFTSNSAAPEAGDYSGLYFYKGSSNSEFEYCTFEYAGNISSYGAIFIEESSVKFANCQFMHMQGNAIVLEEAGRFTTFTNNTFSQIEKNPITIRSNYAHTIGAGNTFNSGAYGIIVTQAFDISGTYTWLKHDAPYIFENLVRVGSAGGGVNLTISAGATLKFMDNAGLDISYWDEHYAKLIANGTDSEPIVFTSGSPSPDKGDWNGIYFYKGVSGSILNHCEVLYAGSSDYYGAIMLDESGSNMVTITNSRIAYSASYGITVDSGSSVDISTDTFDNNNGADYHER
ncbi:MAG: right-handed parallel beta-helix repeat-containing protein [Salinivirgaceae bacterium]|nr:right-handed parallel beta-helix repeat-containing protein [Salinivirgaceae bacterium]MDD4747613.1 right-handed parallel beta-helix repeat-containing protein [Salinivirgaceae bacterium]